MDIAEYKEILLIVLQILQFVLNWSANIISSNLTLCLNVYGIISPILYRLCTVMYNGVVYSLKIIKHPLKTMCVKILNLMLKLEITHISNVQTFSNYQFKHN